MREFIVEADGGSRGNPGPAGYGSVVIDAATGETLAEAAEYIGVATNNVAEYRGLIAGLKAARDLDPSAPVRVRMDSKLVVEQMSGRWKIKHPDMKPLAAEAASILPRPRSHTSGSPASRTNTPTASPTRRWTRASGANSGPRRLRRQSWTRGRRGRPHLTPRAHPGTQRRARQRYGPH